MTIVSNQNALTPAKLFIEFRRDQEPYGYKFGYKAMDKFTAIQDKSEFLKPLFEFVRDEHDDRVRAWGISALGFMEGNNADQAFSFLIDLIEKENSPNQKERFVYTRFFAMRSILKLIKTEKQKEELMRIVGELWKDETEDILVQAGASILFTKSDTNDPKLKFGAELKIKKMLGEPNTCRWAFDLTLKDHPESYCDLNVDSSQLLNSGLWESKRENKFRPWYWPTVPEYVLEADKRIAETTKYLDNSILETLGLFSSFSQFSRTTSELLGNNPQKVTFRELATESGKGLRGKDCNNDEEVIARIASNRVAGWLEKIVLPGQDILVDAPHLISRYPSLLNGSHDSLETWSKIALPFLKSELNIDNEKINCYKFKKDFWLSRPAWLWAEVSKDNKILEVSTPWKREKTKFLFCEDSSTFENQKNCLEFRADVDSVYVQRYVNSPLIEGVNYQPRVRIM